MGKGYNSLALGGPFIRGLTVCLSQENLLVVYSCHIMSILDKPQSFDISWYHFSVSNALAMLIPL